MKRWIFAIWLVLDGSAMAQTTNTTVVPTGFENQSGNTSDSIFMGGLELQQLFRASALPTGWNGAVSITGVAFRVAEGAAGSFSAVVPRIEIYMSTTTRTPEQMTPFYFSNKGPDETAVFAHDNFFCPVRMDRGLILLTLRSHLTSHLCTIRLEEIS